MKMKKKEELFLTKKKTLMITTREQNIYCSTFSGQYLMVLRQNKFEIPGN